MKLDGDRFAFVPCNLPSCDRKVRRRDAAPVAVVVDGVRIRGLACSPVHAGELMRGWRTGDAHGAQFVTEAVA